MNKFEEIDDDSLPSAQPDELMPVGLDGLLGATEKVLGMNRGLLEPDNRDSIVNKRLLTPADLVAERVKLDVGGTLRKLVFNASKKRNLSSMSPGALTPLTEGFLIGNPLVTPLEQINPIDEMNQARRVTLMGPGGISGADMITQEMQSVDAGAFGFVSPLEGPESEAAGIDTRLADKVRIGSNGRIYQQFRNAKTGDIYWMAPEDLVGRKIGLPK